MKLYLKKIKKPAIYFASIVIGIYLLIGLYSVIFEYEEIKVDWYNFTQLKKVKPILQSIPKDAKKFYGLKEFNNQYKANIQPIKNCYQISNTNGKYGYIFGFRMESLIFKSIYYSRFYIYPGYDIGYDQICDGGCYDYNWYTFKYVISNPCKK